MLILNSNNKIVKDSIANELATVTGNIKDDYVLSNSLCESITTISIIFS